MPKDTAKQQEFKGYSSPNYTPVPDELFDEQLPDLSGAELKVLLYVIRRTFGFKKDTDNISLSQLLNGITTRDGKVLDRGTGLSKKTLLETLRKLVDKKLIITERRRSEERGDEPTTYQLNILGSTLEKSTTPRGVKSIPGGGEKSSPGGWSNNYPTQETVLQNTDIQYRNSNNKLENNRSKDNAISHGTQTIGDILKKKMVEKSTIKKTIPNALKAAVQIVSEELGDRRNVHANLTRAVNLSEKAGKNIDSFDQYIYQAKSITSQQAGVKKKMPYFFGVLEELVGLKSLV